MISIAERLHGIKNRWADEGDIAAEAADIIETQMAEITLRAGDVAYLEQQLAASQAREKVLRNLPLLVINENKGRFCNNVAVNAIAAVRGWIEDELEIIPTDDTALKAALAEGQAREKVLRDAINGSMTATCGVTFLKALNPAMLLPTDDSAIKAAIQHGISEFLERTGQYVTNDASRNAALAAERERCAEMCENLQQRIGYEFSEIWTSACAKAIRTLGEEK